MQSKEALKNIKTLSYCKQHITIQEWCNIIEQDLERLEKLERDNQNDKEFIKLQNEVIKIREDEISKLKKIIEILKDYLRIKVFIDMDNEYCLDACDYAIPYLDKEQYELLKNYINEK